MPGNFRHVPLGHLTVSTNPAEVLGVYGLGSCVAVIMYDPAAIVGGVLHALLPTKPRTTSSLSTLPTKFVDQGIHKLLTELCAAGAETARSQVYLCGGAKVVAGTNYNEIFNIGQRNIEAAQKILQEKGLKIDATAVGGNKGRTVKLHILNGRLTVKALGEAEHTLHPRSTSRRNK